MTSLFNIVTLKLFMSQFCMLPYSSDYVITVNYFIYQILFNINVKQYPVNIFPSLIGNIFTILGARGEIIVDITHSLVVERSYFHLPLLLPSPSSSSLNQGRVMVRKKRGKPCRNKLRCKLPSANLVGLPCNSPNFFSSLLYIS